MPARGHALAVAAIGKAPSIQTGSVNRPRRAIFWMARGRQRTQGGSQRGTGAPRDPKGHNERMGPRQSVPTLGPATRAKTRYEPRRVGESSLCEAHHTR